MLGEIAAGYARLADTAVPNTKTHVVSVLTQGEIWRAPRRERVGALSRMLCLHKRTPNNVSATKLVVT
ncbi:hypothetical protein EVAR_45060_1 [Eumeta japonica]|uniref:Uncharacterized protein n=1 Tax=Eumeta variegata TaxID=151549 RepID=A0A4C1ZCH5_EUMVA|nr:hypothetical protein EVAR_45060_1 [Eumeta japonica]